MSLTILIPVKNESQIIEKTIFALENSWIKEIDHEIIFVDDFSEDDTIEKINNHNKNLIKIKIIKNKKPGLGSAISEGINNSTKDYLSIFMSDLSDSLDDLKTYFETIKNENLDSVFGSRFIKGSKIIDYPFQKLILNRVANNLISLFFLTNWSMTFLFLILI